MLLKNFVTLVFLGNKGIGPFIIDIGGKGIALTIVAFLFVSIFNSFNFIVDIKLIIVLFFLNFKFFKIFFPTFGVIAKNIQSELFIINWLSDDIFIFLLFFF